MWQARVNFPPGNTPIISDSLLITEGSLRNPSLLAPIAREHIVRIFDLYVTNIIITNSLTASQLRASKRMLDASQLLSFDSCKQMFKQEKFSSTQVQRSKKYLVNKRPRFLNV